MELGEYAEEELSVPSAYPPRNVLKLRKEAAAAAPLKAAAAPPSPVAAEEKRIVSGI